MDQAVGLAEIYLSLSRPQQAASVYQRAIDALEGKPGGADGVGGGAGGTGGVGGADGSDSRIAVLSAYLANAEFVSGHFERARDIAGRISQRRTDGLSDEELRIMLKTRDVLGDAETKLGNDEAAFKARSLLVGCARQLEAMTGDQSTRLNTAITLGKLAESCVAAGDFDRACETAAEAVGKLEKLVGEFGTAAYGRNLVNALCKLGDAQNARAGAGEAIGQYERALELARSVADETGTLGSRRNLALVLYRMASMAKAIAEEERAHGEAEHAAADEERAAAFIDEAVRIRRELCEAGNQPSDKAYLGKCLVLATSYALDRGDSAAIALGAEGLRVLDECIAMAEQPDTIRSRALCAHYLGLACRRWGSLDDAARSFEIAVADNQTLAERFGRVLDIENLVAELLALGDALQDGGSLGSAGSAGSAGSLGSLGEAARAYSHACDTAQQLAQQTGRLEHAKTWFVALGKLGRNQFVCGNYDVAGDALSTALGLVPDLVTKYDTSELRYSAAEDYGYLAQVLEEVGSAQDTREAYQAALIIAKDLVDRTSQASCIELYLRIAEQSGDFERRLGCAHEARAAYITAAPYAEVLARQVGREEYWAEYISLLVKASWVPADELETGELLQLALTACGDFAAACPGSRVAAVMAEDIRSRLAGKGGLQRRGRLTAAG